MSSQIVGRYESILFPGQWIRIGYWNQSEKITFYCTIYFVTHQNHNHWILHKKIHHFSMSSDPKFSYQYKRYCLNTSANGFQCLCILYFYCVECKKLNKHVYGNSVTLPQRQLKLIQQYLQWFEDFLGPLSLLLVSKIVCGVILKKAMEMWLQHCTLCTIIVVCVVVDGIETCHVGFLSKEIASMGIVKNHNGLHIAVLVVFCWDKTKTVSSLIRHMVHDDYGYFEEAGEKELGSIKKKLKQSHE